MVIGPGTHLDCRGHAIRPTAEGTSVTAPSDPLVGLFVRQAGDVTIQNCAIVGFDFPIFAAQGKTGQPNRFLHNTVVGRSTAISLVEVDDTSIVNNEIKFTTAGGLGVLVLRNSDRNRIIGNVIGPELTSPPSLLTRLPGPAGVLNPASPGGNGGILINYGSGVPALLHAVVEGELVQFPAEKEHLLPGPWFPEDTLVIGNRIEGTALQNAVNVTSALRPVIRGNHIENARTGVLLGAASYNVAFDFPGVCSTTERRCLTDPDCPTPETCVGEERRTALWLSQEPVVEENDIAGNLLMGMQVAVPGAMIRGNRVTGPIWPGASFFPAGGVGIDLRRFALGSSTVTGNTISGFAAALRFGADTGQEPAPYFAARIHHNDFIDSPFAVFVDVTTVMKPADLSVGICSGDPTVVCSRIAGGLDDPGSPIDESQEECAALGLGVCVDRQGNHWGLTCEESGGFAEDSVLLLTSGGISSSGVVTVGGTVFEDVRDRHPYAAPVVGVAPESLPPICSTMP